MCESRPDSAGPGWALVGDAGYFKDPLTAHGITDALIQAEHLARAIIRDSAAALLEYQERRDATTRLFFDATDRIASMEWDMETLQRDHRTIAQEMKREVASLEALNARPRVAA